MSIFPRVIRDPRIATNIPTFALVPLCLLSANVSTASAQQPQAASPVTRTEVLKRTLPPGDFREFQATVIELAPDASAPRHRHDVAVFAYVLEGTVENRFNGDTVETRKAGESWWESPGTVHDTARNASRTSRARLLIVYVGETGKSPTVPLEVGRSPTLAVEIAAARHLLARSHRFTARDITVDPGFSDSISAPGSPGSTRRESSRSAELARALNARVSSVPDLGSVHLTLSEPAMRGDTATVTGTIGWPAKGGSARGYETVALLLVRERGTWRVAREHQLGIS